MQRHRRLIAALLATGLLVSCAVAIAASTTVQAQRRLEQAMSRLEDAVTTLALNRTLNQSETSALREQLAGVYNDLEEVKALLDDNSAPAGGDPQQWVAYSDATLDVSPPTARFSGWNRGYSVYSDFASRQSGITVLVDNVKYTAHWTIRNAYSGNVKAKASPEDNGDVLIKVIDVLGNHWFRIANGGLGPLYASAKGDYSGGGPLPGGGKTAPNKPLPEGGKTAPNNPPGQGGAQAEVPQGKWYQAYRDLVKAGQLGKSEAMEWFIDQAGRYDYESDALRDLGQACKQLEGKPAIERVGRLMYYSAGTPKKLPIPDPRVSPADFVHAINKAYLMEQSGEWYEVSLDVELE